MRRCVFLLYALICSVCIPLIGTTQVLNWNMNLKKPWTFTSQNPTDDPGVSINNTWQINVADLMAFDLKGGIHGINLTLNDPNGYAEVSVYLYDGTKKDTSRGPLLYQCKANRSSINEEFIHDSIEYEYGEWLEWWPDQDDDQPPFLFNGSWKSTDIKTSMLAAVQNNYNGKFSNSNPTSVAFLSSGGVARKLPVVIDVTIYKANVHALSIPGIGVIGAEYFNPPLLSMTAGTFTFPPGSNAVEYVLNNKVIPQDVHISDEVPNARTFVGIKGSQLDIGVISGDLGDKNGYRGLIATKTHGMHNYEVSQFCQYKQYDQLVNLDSGSSTQLWLNGTGPLQTINGYPLVNDNQGPYYSRLLSSFVMLVPKLHTEQIKQRPGNITGNHEVFLKNDGINWFYNDATDLSKPKAFIDLSPSMDKLNIQNLENGVSQPDGLIMMRFKCGDPGAKGAVLFYMGEDMYYPDTKGIDIVKPRLRNMMIVGVGRVLPSLRDSLNSGMRNGTITAGPGISLGDFGSLLNLVKMPFYYIKISEGKIIEYILYYNTDIDPMDGQYHTLSMVREGKSEISSGSNICTFDGLPIGGFTNPSVPVLYAGKDITHAYIGAMNLDGRFLTGDANLTFSDVLFVADYVTLRYTLHGLVFVIQEFLRSGPGLPDWTLFAQPKIYALEFGEQAGNMYLL